LVPGIAAYLRLALVVHLVATFALIFLLGSAATRERDRTDELKNALDWSEYNLDQQRQVADVADQLKRDADARAAAAEDTLSEYKSKFGDNPLDPPPGFLDWLRSQQQHRPRAASGSTAGGSRSNVVPRLRAPGG
jgi:hypothetical protein